MNFAVPPRSVPIESIIQSTEPALRHLTKTAANDVRIKMNEVLRKARPAKPNLTKTERFAVIDLRRDNSIHILTADKGNATVVMDREDYSNMVKDILSSGSYRPLPKNSIPAIEKRVASQLLLLHRADALSTSSTDDSDPPVGSVPGSLLFSVARQFLRANGWDLHRISFIPIFMEEFESSSLLTVDLRPSLWLRYVDETFVVWPHGPDTLQDFLQYINKQHTSISFTMEQEQHGTIPFLDVKISRNPDGTLGHSVYMKPTHTDRYLYQRSFHHPQHQVIGQPHPSPASHHLQRILRQAGVKVYHSSGNKLQGSLHTHKDNQDSSSKAGVYRIPCECVKVYIGETDLMSPERCAGSTPISPDTILMCTNQIHEGSHVIQT
ncbi:uncharacterized protein LOC119725058 [Patiria miniata]|uniref:Uncharacterized protein n=1 Tax=Patiria miniata TaxID=46514 RepID=A0A913ZLY8_PATMI|nr:uncharacterized protein LOC119725058 [Patiria miniata]